MVNPQIKEFYFGNYATQPTTMGNSNLKCRMQCIEWSDGRLGCQQTQRSFKELQEAYARLQEKGALDKEGEVSLLMDIIRTYNDEYQRNTNGENEIPLPDFMSFVKCILEVEEKGKEILPASIRAELYREACYFEKCFEFDATASQSKDEQEIIAEVQYRASHGDSKPFIIEHCEYYRNNVRHTKRYPCPNSNC
ncbi:MAG: hypothetical protein J6Q73_08205 [Bacteroidaceae bacterium]|nr:hypothetical protein [Bacteroidaceae bacterium]